MKNFEKYIFKYIWLIVIMPKEIQAVELFALAIFFLYDMRKRKICFDNFSKLVIIYIFVHVLSVLISLSQREYEPRRIFAIINTIGIWGIAVIFYLYYKDKKWDEIYAKYAFMNYCIMIIMSFVYLLISRFSETFIVPYFNRTLYILDDHGRTRLVAFLDYPTLIVPFFLLMVPLALYYIESLKVCQRKEIIATVFFVISCIPVIEAKSRSGMVLITICAVWIIGCYLTNERKIHKMFWGISFVLFMAMSGMFRDILRRLIEMRSGSNMTRMEIYRETIDGIIEHPLIGCGIKSIGAYGYPLGSHSSYLGFIYKAGIVGGIFIFIAIGNMTYRLFKKYRCSNNIMGKILIIYALLMLVYMGLEDLDGANWLICLYFAYLGILNSKENSYIFLENDYDNKKIV